ncbi:MAG: helix-turn-helix domain-containing protein [bacterium]|nr:helix-turn-helix domain-containing protein [bacterium]
MSAFSLVKARRRSPASLALECHGVSQRQLAIALNLSSSSLARILQGRQPVPTGLVAALRAVIGADAATEVLTAIDEVAP